METYLMMLYVTLDQESALKTFFEDQGWSFCKPDLSVTTDKLGPAVGNAPKLNADAKFSQGIIGKRKASSPSRKAPKIKLVKVVANTRDADNKTAKASKRSKGIEEKELNPSHDTDMDMLGDIALAPDDDEEITDMIAEMKKRNRYIKGSEDIVENQGDTEPEQECVELAENYDVGDEGNDDTDDSVEELNNAGSGEKLDGSNVSIEYEIQAMNSGNVDSFKKNTARKSDDGQDSDENKPEHTPEDVINKLLSQSQEPDCTYKCCICGKEIKVKYNMKRHLRTHLPDQINCIMCNRFFDSLEKKEEHMRKRHSNRHICETCGVSFKRKSDLNAHAMKHESAVDQDMSPGCFRCTYKDCGKVFFRQTNYEYHLNVHSGLRPYECVRCLKSFHSKYTKNEHEKDCVNDVEYKCDICGNVFKQRSGLHNHKQAEHVRREKGYQCVVCSQMFKFSSGLIRHKKEKHQLSDASQQTELAESLSAVKVESEVIPDTEREFITPNSDTAFIVVADIEPENKGENTLGAEATAVETSVEEIPVTSHAEIMATMSEQVLQGSGEINIERVIVVHQVASDLPQHLEELNN